MTNVLDFNIGQMLNFGLKWKLRWCQNPMLDSLKLLTLDRRWVLIWNENQVDVKTQCLLDVKCQHWRDIAFWLEKIQLSSKMLDLLKFPPLDRHWLLIQKENWVDIKAQCLLDVNLQQWMDIVFWLGKKCGGCQNSTLYLLKPPPLDRRWLLVWNENWVDIKTQHQIYIIFHSIGQMRSNDFIFYI